MGVNHYQTGFFGWFYASVDNSTSAQATSLLGITRASFHVIRPCSRSFVYRGSFGTLLVLTPQNSRVVSAKNSSAKHGNFQSSKEDINEMTDIRKVRSLEQFWKIRLPLALVRPESTFGDMKISLEPKKKRHVNSSLYFVSFVSSRVSLRV